MIWAAAGALLGALFGSFVATVAVRWPQRRSVMRGRSCCDGCGTAIGAARLVPLLSYASQRGRAACCGAAIDPIHPVGELLGAAIGLLSVIAVPDLAAAAAGALFGWLLLALALLDARHFWLPDRLTATLAVTGISTGLIGLAPPIGDRLIGGAAGLLAFLAVRYGYRLLRGREGMGAGDAKLFGAIGLWLGWQMLPAVLFAAALGGLLWALILMAGGRRMTPSSTLPFGVFLALAGWGCWVAMVARFHM